jgi:hypothetical protein
MLLAPETQGARAEAQDQHLQPSSLGVRLRTAAARLTQIVDDASLRLCFGDRLRREVAVSQAELISVTLSSKQIVHE